MVVNLAAFIQVVTTRIGKDMNLLVKRAARPHETLPLHQFITKFASIRAGQQVRFGQKALPRAGKTEPQFSPAP